jgi:hypothetical protein
MSDFERARVFDHGETGLVLQCYDTEIADQFDDFLIDNLDQEIPIRFEEGHVSFFFGREFSVTEITALFGKFEKELDMI